jgi:hypothetical protein
MGASQSGGTMYVKNQSKAMASQLVVNVILKLFSNDRHSKYFNPSTFNIPHGKILICN